MHVLFYDQTKLNLATSDYNVKVSVTLSAVSEMLPNQLTVIAESPHTVFLVLL